MKIPILLLKRPNNPEPSVCSDRCWYAMTTLPFPVCAGPYGMDLKATSIMDVGTTPEEAKKNLIDKVQEVLSAYRIVRQDEIEVPTFEVEAKLY